MTSLVHHHYNPDWLSDDALLASFVARQRDFAFLRDELARAPLTGNVQHYLLVGLRGAGKTTLLKRLAVAIRRDENLSGHLIALSFPEELYQVKNLADFWWAACDALADELDLLKHVRDADDLLNAVMKARSCANRSDSISNAGFEVLQQTCMRLKRRPVLLVDNLDVVFERIDKNGRKLKDPHSPAYWALRELLSTNVSPIVIGGSVRLSSHFTDYENAFYDFFVAKRLGKLPLPEVLEVLDRLADTKGAPEVKQRLRARPGRVEALFELTGGNPRAIGLIFELLRNGPNSRTVEDFERLMDLTTPYYKARIEDLSEQAQVVMHALAVRRVGAGANDHLRFGHTAVEIGDHAGLPTNTVSTQLGILENEGLVEKSAAHGRTQYRIAEQLFRLWLQMRGTRRIRQNVLELTKFFEAMYDADELLKMAMKPCGASELAEAKYAIAVAASGDTPTESRELLERYATEQLRQHVAKNGGEMDDYLPAITDEVLSKQIEIDNIESSMPINRLDSQLTTEEQVSQLLDADPKNTKSQRALSVRHMKIGDTLAARGDEAGALASYETALAILLALLETDPRNPKSQRALSVSHVKIGDTLAAHGDQAGALASYEAALALRVALLKTDPQNTQWQRDLSVTYERIGNMLAARGDSASALASHEAALAIRLALLKTDSQNIRWQRDLSVSRGKIGDMLAVRGDQKGALASYKATLAINLALLETDPQNTQWQRDLSVTHGRIGGMLAGLGDQFGALASYEAALAIRLGLLKAEPENTQWQRDLSVTHEKIGDILDARGDEIGALASYEAALAIRLALSKIAPRNTQWQRDLAMSYSKIGGLLAAREDQVGALASYKAALAIRLVLLETDRQNTQWQRDLSVTHERIGNILAAQEDIAGALTSHEAALAIRLALLKTDPKNTQWQRDLSVSHGRIGDMLVARNDQAGALASYEATLTINLALLETDPQNIPWQHDISVTQGRIGDMLAMRGDYAGALASYEAALAIRLVLLNTAPKNTTWERERAMTHERIGDMLAARSDQAGALASYKAALAIKLALLDTDPKNTQWQRDLSVSQVHIGDMLVARGELADALASYKEALAIRLALLETDPKNTQWQRDLSVTHERMGNILAAHDDVVGALASHEMALSIRLSLLKTYPNKIEWKRDLAVSHERVGDVLVACNDLTSALTSYKAALTIRTELSKFDLPLRLTNKYADLWANIYTDASRKALASGNQAELRAALTRLIADPVDIAAVLVSTHVVEGLLASALVNGQFAIMLLNEMRDLGYEKYARPLVLAFEAEMTHRSDMISELEPEIQAATLHMFERLQSGILEIKKNEKDE